ncbi:MAG: nuclear transport factor 2 family protein [Solirubrobacterales bacterium]|nr:nuclear transport factor 2 family protein [Solirubrobacterales bacterium]
MPWLPELFSAPVLQRLQEKWERELVTVPFFDGLMTGELDALVESFVHEPELHHPVRGRIRGVPAFSRFVAETRAWLSQPGASVENVEHVVRAGRHACGEVVLHVEGKTEQVGLPVAIVADREPGGRIDELRMYYSSWPLRGRHATRPPLLQPYAELPASDVVGKYQRALAAGDVDAIVAVFEPDGYAREPAGGDYLHQGTDGVRAFYERLFANGGGIPLEHCALIDDERACALEYNVVRWGATELPPQAGVAVYVRGDSGKIAAARIYDDVDPPLGSRP